MKTRIDPLEPTYTSCIASGKIKEKIPDKALVKSLVEVANRGLAFINNSAKHLPQDSSDWTFVFRDHYESLRGLIEAYLLLQGIDADQHQCKNAYICHKNQELELNWEFLETARLLRNAINYRGILLQHDQWKEHKINFELHIKTLQKAIEEKLKE